MNPELLDDELLKQFRFKTNEDKVWSGAPKQYFSISMIDMIWRNTNVSVKSAIQIILSFLSIKFIINVFLGHFIFYTLLKLIVFWTIIVLAEIYKNWRKRNTKYILTNERIIIETIQNFKTKIHSIKLDQIEVVTYEVYKDNVGLIYIKLSENRKLITKDFFSGQKRMYTTLELIQDCLKVYDLILSERRKYIGAH